MNKNLWISILIGYIMAFIFFGASVLYDLWKIYSAGCSIASSVISMIFGALIFTFIVSIILVIFIYKKKPHKEKERK